MKRARLIYSLATQWNALLRAGAGRLVTGFFFLVCLLGANRGHAQSASDLSSAIDDLKATAVAKIDAEVEINSRAFADAKNIQQSLRWSDWFGVGFDLS